MKTKTEQQMWNQENIKQVVDVLVKANYRAGRILGCPNLGSVEFWVGPGRIPVVAIHTYAHDSGFDIYVPITQSNRMDETLYALRDATNVKVSADCRTSQSA